MRPIKNAIHDALLQLFESVASLPRMIETPNAITEIPKKATMKNCNIVPIYASSQLIATQNLLPKNPRHLLLMTNLFHQKVF